MRSRRTLQEDCIYVCAEGCLVMSVVVTCAVYRTYYVGTHLCFVCKLPHQHAPIYAYTF